VAISELATAFVRVRPNLTGFKQEAQAGVATAGAGLGKAFGLAFGIGAGFEIVKFIEESVKRGAAEAAALTQTEQSIKNAGAQWEVYGQTVEDVFNKQELTKGFDLTDQAAAFGKIVQQTKDTERALEDLNIAMDVARARHLGLGQVAVALARLEGGNAQSLSRLGIVLPKVTVAQDKLKAAHNEAIVSGEKFNAIQGAEYKAALEVAKAQDKATTATGARAEVTKRYAGQADAFAGTAVGAAARMHVAVENLQEAVGKQLLPALASAAEEATVFFQDLSENRELLDGVRGIVSAIGQAVGFTKDALVELAPAFHVIAEVVSTLGGAPIAAALIAWKALPPVLALTGTAFDKVALSEAAVATNTQLASARLTLWMAQADLAAASANGLAAAEARVAVASAAMAEAQTAATAAQTRLTAASAGVGVGLTGMLGPIALAAGAVFFLQQYFEKADTSMADFQKTANSLASNLANADLDVAGLGISRDQAQNQSVQANLALAAARQKLAADRAGDVSLKQLAASEAAVTQARLAATSAAHSYTSAVKQLDEATVKQRIGEQAVTADVQDLGAQLEAVKDKVAVIAEWKGPEAALAAFGKMLDNLAEANPALEAQVKNLKGIVEATGKIPSRKTIQIVLDPRLDASVITEQITSQVNASVAALRGPLADALGNLIPAGLTGGLKPLDFSNFSKDMGIAIQGVVPEAKKLKPVITDSLVGGAQDARVDVAAEFAKALADGVTSAKQNLTSIGQTIGDDIGQVMDARLAAAEAKLATSPAAAEIKSLLAEAKFAQDRISSRQRQNTASDAARALADLQRAFGTGAHTAEQDAQLQDAQNAVLDAADQTRADAAQARADALQTGLDQRQANLEKRNEAEKAAAQQRLTDLNDAVNRGLITEKTYVTRLNKLLRDEGVNFKSAGAALGSAFAAGFREQLQGALAQAKILANLTPGQRGRGTGGAPTATDPLGDARRAAQTASASNAAQDRTAADAASRVAANTAETVAEIKKLGGVVTKKGTTINITIPAGTPEKNAAEVVKLQKALAKGAG